LPLLALAGMGYEMGVNVVLDRPINDLENSLLLSGIIVLRDAEAHQAVNDELVAAILGAGIVEDFQQWPDAGFPNPLIQQQAAIQIFEDPWNELCRWPVNAACLLAHASKSLLASHF